MDGKDRLMDVPLGCNIFTFRVSKGHHYLTLLEVLIAYLIMSIIWVDNRYS